MKMIYLFSLIIQTANKPTATLTPARTTIRTGGSVTLTCSVYGSEGWKFYCYKRSTDSSEPQVMRNNKLDRVIVSEGGHYYCRGGRGDQDPLFYTEPSSEVTIEKIGEFSHLF